MTRQAFERQASALLGAKATANTHIILYLDIDRLHVINETFGMHVGDDVIVNVAECMAKSLPPGRPVGAHFRRPARGADPEFQHGRSGDRRRKNSRRGRRHRAARRPGLLRSVGLSRRRADRPLRQSAGACFGDGGDRLQGGQGSRPQTASRCSRIRIRASSAAIPTSWSSASCAKRSPTTASGSMHSPYCRCAATMAGRASNC